MMDFKLFLVGLEFEWSFIRSLMVTKNECNTTAHISGLTRENWFSKGSLSSDHDHDHDGDKNFTHLLV